MKKTTFLKLTAILLLGFAFNSCSDSKNDEPQPEPTPNPETKFKSILTIVDGQLANVPQSVFEFGAATYENATKFEDEHGAKLAGEHSETSTITPGDGSDPIKVDVVTYDFNTQDPKGDNPKRTYTFNKKDQKLVKAQIMVRTSLVMKNEKDLQDLFLKALTEAGYKSEDNLVFHTDKIQLTIEKSKDICTFSYKAYKEESKPSKFKPFLKFDAEGHLAALPIPFSKWGSTPDKAMEWEKEYGSTLNEKEDLISKGAYMFLTNDPEGKNPARVYQFSSQKALVTSSIAVKKEIALNSTGSGVSEDMEILLSDNGYRKVETKDGSLTYTNGAIIMSISEIKGGLATIIFKKGTSEAFTPFVSDVKDFPMLTKKPLGTTKEEIAAFEEKLGLRKLSQKDNLKPGQFRYIINKESADKSNIAQVVYGTQMEKDSKGKDLEPGITIISLSFSSLDDFLTEAKGKAWMRANGFEFVKKDAIGALQYAKFKSTNNKWQAYCIYDSNALLISLTYFETSGGGGEETPKEKVRFFLPLIDWTAKVEKTGKIMDFEKSRNFNASWKIRTATDEADKDAGKGTIFAYPDFKIRSDESNRFSNMTYYSKSKDDMTLDLVFIGINRGSISNPNNPNVDDKDINDYIKSQGFTFIRKDVDDLGFMQLDYILYVNKEKNAQLLLLKGRASRDTLNITIVKDGTYTAHAAIKKVVKLRKMMKR